MRLIYQIGLDEKLAQLQKEGKDTSEVEAIIQLYQVINSGQLDSSNVDLSSVASQEKWREVGATGQVAFQNSWVNFDSGATSTAGYMKDSLGFVHLKGLVKSGTIGQIIFILPTGYRPAGNTNYSVSSNSAFGSVSITSSGNVTADVGNNAWVSLNGITFKAQ